MPNKLQIIQKDYNFNFAKENVWKIKIMDKYQVQAQQCQDEKKCPSDFISGTWSPVYD
jgi:hypothetical protein